MANLGSVANRINDDLNRDDLTAQAKLEIVSAIRYYQSNLFWFTEEKATTNTVANQELVALPDDYLSHLSLRITDGNWSYPLKMRDYSWLEESYDPQSFGCPVEFALWEEQIRLFPIPDSSDYVLTMSYYRKFDELSNDSDSNQYLADECEEMIRSRAEAQLCYRYLQDIPRGDRYTQLEQMSYNRCVKRTNAALSTRQTKSWGFK